MLKCSWHIAKRSHNQAALLVQDIFTLFHLGKDFKFVSKPEIFFIPIVGWSMYLTGMHSFAVTEQRQRWLHA